MWCATVPATFYSKLFNRSLPQSVYDQKQHLGPFMEGEGRRACSFCFLVAHGSRWSYWEQHLSNLSGAPSSPWWLLKESAVWCLISGWQWKESQRRDSSACMMRYSDQPRVLGRAPVELPAVVKSQDAFRKKPVVKEIGKLYSWCPIHSGTYLTGLLSAPNSRRVLRTMHTITVASETEDLSCLLCSLSTM